MNQLMQYLTENQPGFWESLPSRTRSWIEEDLQDNLFVNILVEACKGKKTHEIRTLLLETWATATNEGGDSTSSTSHHHPSPFLVSQVIPSNEPGFEKTDSFWTWAGGITMLIFVILLVFGGGVEKALGVDIPFVPFFTTLQTPQTETVVEEVVTSTTINGELVVQGCQLVTFDENGWPNWVAKNEDGFAIPTSLPDLTANPQKICLSDLTAWQSFITSGNSDQTAGQWLANKICKASGYNDPKCDDAIVAAFQSAKKLKVEPVIVDGVKYPYQRQAGIFTLPAWPPGSNNQSSTSEVTDSSALGGDPSSGNDPNTGSSQEEQGEEAPQTTEVAQTPYPTFTPTPNTVEEARAVEQGESDKGPQELDPVNMSELTSRSAPIWGKPGIDSVEIRMYESGVNTSWIAWAPSYAAAEYYMWVWETQTLANLASQAGCSSFVLEGALIYEAKVSNTLTFVRNDSAGVAKYMFPAEKTSVFGCYIWPTSTPAPTSTPQPTSPPAAPTYTPVPTATATSYVSECNITINWQNLISNPGQVTGSGNSYLIKHAQDPNNRVYVGNVTEYAIKYCLTGLPNQINGATWNQQIISLTGPQYGGVSGECNISGTDIWVADCWK